jgi:hypothetical protein
MNYHIDNTFIQTLINALEFWPKWTIQNFSKCKIYKAFPGSIWTYDLGLWSRNFLQTYVHIGNPLSWFKLARIKAMKFNTFIKHISAILWHSLAIVTHLSSVPQRSSIPLMPPLLLVLPTKARILCFGSL